MTLQLRLSAIAYFIFLFSDASAQNKWYVNDASLVDDVFTTAVGNDANAGTAALPFATIAHALSVASDHDSIFVDAGTFPEEVTISLPIVLSGVKRGIPAGPEVNPAGRGVAAGETIIEGNFIFGQSVDNITVDGFYINKGSLQFGIHARGYDCKIVNNMITGVVNLFTQQCGIATRANAPLRTHSYEIRNNHITNVRFGIYFDGNQLADEPSLISYNYVGYAGQTGLVLTGSSGHRWKGNVVEFCPQGMLLSYGNLLIEQNTFRNNVLSGIRLAANNPSLLKNNTIVNNYIINNGIGINLTADDPEATGNQAHFNHLSGNLLNIQSVITPEFDASCNWFGSNDIGDISASISGNVRYAPYLSNGTDIDVIEAGFQTDLSCIVVPVKLTNFEAMKVNADVKLKWNTENEINNSHFEIERSSDGVNFQFIASVNGNGNSTTLLSYDYNDRNAMSLNNLWFYRLKQIDFDGGFNYSTVAVVKGTSISRYAVYPNPSRNTFQIRLNETASEAVGYRLISTAGNVVKRGLLNGNVEQVNTSSLSNGIYILEIYDRSGATQKIRVSILK